MRRLLEPEILDSLSPHDPAAVHNRRDLLLTNRVMRNHAWFRHQLPRVTRQGEKILELGAGTGELARSLHAAGFQVDGLDLWPAPPGWPTSRAWHRGDLRTFDGWDGYRVVIANLILHQFQDSELVALGERLAGCRAIIACEPARRRASQFAYRIFAPLFGANAVTLHDAHVSIAAGFREKELPEALRLRHDVWQVHCSTTMVGAYHMTAVRRDGSGLFTMDGNRGHDGRVWEIGP